MGGIFSAIVAIIKAVPSIERLFLHIADQVKKANAEREYKKDLDCIDAAIADAITGVQDSRISRPEWNLDADRSPSVSDGSETSTGVYPGSADGSSEIEQNGKE